MIESPTQSLRGVVRPRHTSIRRPSACSRHSCGIDAIWSASPHDLCSRSITIMEIARSGMPSPTPLSLPRPHRHPGNRGMRLQHLCPYSLDHIEETTTVLARTPAGEPEFHVLTHVDGLGWSVRAEQTIRRDLAVTIREQWGGSTYTAGSTGRQTVLTAMTPLICPGSLIADLGVRLVKFMGLLDPSRPNWGLMYTGCLLPLQGLDPATKMDSVGGSSYIPRILDRHRRVAAQRMWM